MTKRDLDLYLSAGEILPTSTSWRVEDGYLWLSSWEEGQSTTLGIWGPGDLVIPSVFTHQQVQLTCLSAVQVEQTRFSSEDHQAFVDGQLIQLACLLQNARIRQAEERLFSFLLWIGKRFGRVSSHGVSLSFRDMNLTHRNLAEMTGMTRVTVTKALMRFRQEHRLRKQGDDELLCIRADR